MSPDGLLAFNPVQTSGAPALAVTDLTASPAKVVDLLEISSPGFGTGYKLSQGEPGAPPGFRGTTVGALEGGSYPVMLVMNATVAGTGCSRGSKGYVQFIARYVYDGSARMLTYTGSVQLEASNQCQPPIIFQDGGWETRTIATNDTDLYLIARSPSATGLFRQDASGFTRVFVAADAETGKYGSGKCADFSLHHFDTDTALISAQCPKQGSNTVVVFGTGSPAGFGFSETFAALTNTAAAQSYTAVSGKLGSTCVTAIQKESKGDGGNVHTVERICFSADSVASGDADIITKGFQLPSGYGGSVVVVP